MKKLTPSQSRWLSLATGIIICLFLLLVNPFHVNSSACLALAVAGLMITWWVTEALPMPVVALLPIVLFPLLKLTTIEQAAGPYANPVIFLFMGGFMLGLAIEKWNLHKRIALNIVRLTGTSGDRIVLGFIIATGLISMWISNTATTMMMFPIALSVIQVMKENHKGEGNISHFSLTLMLAIAYASNLGGIATIVGTPPNVSYVGYIKEKHQIVIPFLNWMVICTPLAMVLLGCLYLIMVKWMFPNKIKKDHSTRQLIHEELEKLGPLTSAEKRVLIIFICTAFLWIVSGYINKLQTIFKLDDNMIAIMCAVALFICPAGNDSKEQLLEWDDTKKMAWGILLLFGGGISLASLLEKAGLIQQLGQWLAQFANSGFILLLIVSFVSIFISEVMSNVAQVIVFAPVVTSLAIAVGMNPLILGMAMTLSASCASMLPMGTPPNAIVFASGHIKLRQMTRAGFALNIVSVIIITIFCWFLLPYLLTWK